MRYLASALTAVALLLTVPSPADAASANCVVCGDEGSGAGSSGGGYLAWASRVSYSGPGFTGGRGNVSTVDWEPPACWYEPRWDSPEAFERYAETELRVLMHRTGEEQLWSEFQDEYAPYHVGEGGQWWTRTCLDYSTPEARRHTSTRPWAVWIDPAGSNIPPDAISAEVLAGLAVAHLTLPQRKVSVNPAGTSVVNLPTWVWSTDGDAPVSVTASLGPLSSTVTATPTNLRVRADTADAVLHPASGNCAGTGQPYVAGTTDPTATPPCGVTYTRSTATRPTGYGLQAELAWAVTWSSTTGQGGTLPSATTTTTTPVHVAEIQTIVTRTR